jgi:hypothetical protein
VLRFTGKHPWISACWHPVPPSRITQEGEVLLLLAEQQDTAFWGVSADEESADLRVLFWDGRHFEPEGRTLSEFLKGMALMHRTETPPSLATPWALSDESLGHLATLERYPFHTHLSDEDESYFIDGETVFQTLSGSPGRTEVVCGARTRAALLGAMQAAGLPEPRDIELEL